MNHTVWFIRFGLHGFIGFSNNGLQTFLRFEWYLFWHERVRTINYCKYFMNMLRMTNCTNIQCTMFKLIDIHLSADKCEIHIKSLGSLQGAWTDYNLLSSSPCHSRSGPATCSSFERSSFSDILQSGWLSPNSLKINPVFRESIKIINIIEWY